jgi:hypothetical protein
LGARESIPSTILLHPRSSHGVPEERRVEARRRGAIDGGGEVMRAQATRRDQEDHPHPLRRACPEQSYHFSQPRQRGEGPYSRSKVGVQPWHEVEGLQRGVPPSLRTMGIATTPTIVARGRGRPPEEMITICTFGKRCPRRRLPKAPTAATTEDQERPGG